MTTPDEKPIERLLRQNRGAAHDVEVDGELQFGTPSGLPGFVNTQVKINEVIVEQLEKIGADVETLQNDMGQVKGGHARTEVVARAETVAMELGFEYLRQVTPSELFRWSKAAPANTEPNVLQSFQRADLVIEALDDAELVYLAVEISYTVDNSDVTRALRNAELLQQITNHRAEAVVAGAVARPSVQEQVARGDVRWFPTKSGILEPE